MPDRHDFTASASYPSILPVENLTDGNPRTAWAGKTGDEVWLFINGLAYVTISSTGLLFPQHLKKASTIATPVLFGEVAFMLWLLIVGARVQPPAVAADRQKAGMV